MLSSISTCKNDVTHDDSHLSTLHANLVQQIVEPVTDFSLSQSFLLAEPCDRGELCDTSSQISSPQLEIKHPLVSRSICTIWHKGGSNYMKCVEQQSEQLHPTLELEKN
jgi:hypothetical protein